MNNNGQIEATQKYSVLKSAEKAAPPLIVIILVPALNAALKVAGVDIEDKIVYSFALAGLGAYRYFINWIKNRKKEPI